MLLKRRKQIVSFVLFYIFLFACLIGVAMAGSHVVTVISEGTPLSRRHTVILDAGHGGIDGGAVSCTGVLESTINLQIALKLESLLQLLGYDTAMLRTTDTSIHTQGDTIAAKKVSDLKERVRIVNETDNAVLISIHQNYFHDSRYSGAQVFYGKSEDSEALAKALQTALIQTVNPGSNRQIKKPNGIYLMEHIDCTGVLVECGFLSNPEEEYKLRSEEYQKQLCCVIAATLSKFLDG